MMTIFRKRVIKIIFFIVIIILGLLWAAGKLLDQNVYYGEKNLSIASETSQNNAINNYKQAVFLDRYIVFWNDNAEVSSYYSNIGSAYSNLEEYEEALDYNKKAVDAAELYGGMTDVEMAGLYSRMMILATSLDENETAAEYGMQGFQYYESLTDGQFGFEKGMTCIFIAHNFLNIKDYEAASQYFEQGIPLYYENVDWGYGDENYALLLVSAYKGAALSYEQLGDYEKYQEYNEKYDDYVWLRDYSEEEISDYLEEMHLLK